MSTELPVSSPLAEHVDPAGILALIDALEAQPGTDPHGLIVLRHGRRIAAGWWAPHVPQRPSLMYSLSKSFTASALGLAVAESRLDLDRPVADYLPELQDVDVSPRMRRATLRHLVSMRSGHRHETMQVASAAGRDAVRGLFTLEPEDEPGTRFCYNQPPILTVSAAVQATTGQTLTSYLRPRLFEPLGITVAAWKQDEIGRDLGYSGLFTTLDAVARLGELYRCDGLWQGQRVLPEGWAALATTAHADTSGESPPDWRRGYGFGFWLASHGFRGDGAWGQYCIVLPEQAMVVAITSATQSMQMLLDEVWAQLLAAIDRAGEHAVEQQLAARLSTLRLEPAPGTSWEPELAGRPATFTPLSGRCRAQRSLTAVELAADGTVTLVEGDDRTPVTFGTAGDDARVVGAAGVDGDLVLLDLHFVQSPHRMWVTADRRTGHFTAGWLTAALDAPALSDLSVPATT